MCVAVAAAAVAAAAFAAPASAAPVAVASLSATASAAPVPVHVVRDGRRGSRFLRYARRPWLPHLRGSQEPHLLPQEGSLGPYHPGGSNDGCENFYERCMNHGYFPAVSWEVLRCGSADGTSFAAQQYSCHTVQNVSYGQYDDAWEDRGGRGPLGGVRVCSKPAPIGYYTEPGC